MISFWHIHASWWFHYPGRHISAVVEVSMFIMRIPLTVLHHIGEKLRQAFVQGLRSSSVVHCLTDTEVNTRVAGSNPEWTEACAFFLSLFLVSLTCVCVSPGLCEW